MNRDAILKRVRSKLETARAGVNALLLAGGDSFHPVSRLEFIERELTKMLTAIDTGAISPRGNRTPGLWRIILDEWPIKDPLGELIVAAEYEFDRL